MLKTGILRIDHNTNISRLDAGSDDKRLAKKGPGDQLGNATDFLVDEKGLDDGDLIWVTGSDGTHNGVSVFFISDAGRPQEAEAVLTKADALATGLFVKAGKNLVRAAGKGSAKKASGKKSRKGSEK